MPPARTVCLKCVVAMGRLDLSCLISMAFLLGELLLEAACPCLLINYVAVTQASLCSADSRKALF